MLSIDQIGFSSNIVSFQLNSDVNATKIHTKLQHFDDM